jgi:uncharacterized protein YuzE
MSNGKILTVDGITFDHGDYDADADVLYLHVGEPREAADSEETPEGDIVRFDANDRVIGLTLVNAKWRVDSAKPFRLTIPHRTIADAGAIQALLA